MDCEGRDLLKASLPLPARHPRAMLTLIESLALWSGERIAAVISATDRSEPSVQWLDESWPDESALVRFDFVANRERPHRRIHGVGDFRDLRRLQLMLPWLR